MNKIDMLNLKTNIGIISGDGYSTIRGYLCDLLSTLWREGEGFSGKRPFGDSGWEYDLYIPLVQAGVVEGVLDEDGYIEEVDEEKARELVSELIKVCFYSE